MNINNVIFFHEMNIEKHYLILDGNIQPKIGSVDIVKIMNIDVTPNKI